MLIRDNKFDEFTILDKISKINMTHAKARLLASVSRRFNAHLSTYGGSNAYELPPHTTGVFKLRTHKGNIKGLKNIRVPKLTRQPLHKPHHCHSPSNRNINIPSKRHLVVHYYSQVIDRVNTIKDVPTQHVRKFDRMTQS
jgi:hypothetical protein